MGNMWQALAISENDLRIELTKSQHNNKATSRRFYCDLLIRLVFSLLRCQLVEFGSLNLTLFIRIGPDVSQEAFLI